ncbi:beta-propeller fold lactonase family protein [Buchnera aphidicola]|uniref:6-phosphogluconolactonase n=1 Tax=Buchnera aphidicola (Cinara curvipes) TaxID=2518975 RepID=A0A451D6K8_9GAMM|nr:beta-propeller fold lactonase family protein [Buchnera aphidicola]VFP81480.1 6-phosphogluconolactonase [Buchnera aphidicola (Cinara curvipes)]
MRKNIFISCSINKHIEYWILKKNNILSKIKIISSDGIPQPLKYNKKNKLLYVGEKENNKIITYKIYSNNKINKIHEVSICNTPNYISFNQNKNILFCASYHGNEFYVFLINQFGYIKKNIYIFKKIYGCHFIKMHYRYNLIFVTSLKANKIYIYTIIYNKKNKINLILKNIILTKKNSGPRHITFHPLNDYMYSVNEFNGTIDVWIIYNTIFKLKLIQSISLILKPYISIPWASDIHIHPNGKYLYACDRSNSIISLFNINCNTGTLLYIHTYQTELQPRSFNISKDGRILIVVGEISNNMRIYNINLDTGYLIYSKIQSIGKNPLWIIIE